MTYTILLIIQIIKAFNLYREKTGTKKYFWVRKSSLHALG